MLSSGDRVIFNNIFAYPSLSGKKGIVTDVWEDDDYVTVVFDNGERMACRTAEVALEKTPQSSSFC